LPHRPRTTATRGTMSAWSVRALAGTGPRRRAFRRAVAADPRNAEAHYNLAHGLADDRAFDAAVKELKTALLLRPNLGDRISNPKSSRSSILMPRACPCTSTRWFAHTGADRSDGGCSPFDSTGELAPWLVSRSTRHPRPCGRRKGLAARRRRGRPRSRRRPRRPSSSVRRARGRLRGAAPDPGASERELPGGRRVRRGGPMRRRPRNRLTRWKIVVARR
jgi:hypothetical protein